MLVQVLVISQIYLMVQAQLLLYFLLLQFCKVMIWEWTIKFQVDQDKIMIHLMESTPTWTLSQQQLLECLWKKPDNKSKLILQLKTMQPKINLQDNLTLLITLQVYSLVQPLPQMTMMECMTTYKTMMSELQQKLSLFQKCQPATITFKSKKIKLNNHKLSNLTLQEQSM